MSWKVSAETIQRACGQKRLKQERIYSAAVQACIQAGKTPPRAEDYQSELDRLTTDKPRVRRLSKKNIPPPSIRQYELEKLVKSRCR